MPGQLIHSLWVYLYSLWFVSIPLPQWCAIQHGKRTINDDDDDVMLIMSYHNISQTRDNTHNWTCTTLTISWSCLLCCFAQLNFKLDLVCQKISTSGLDTVTDYSFSEKKATHYFVRTTERSAWLAPKQGHTTSDSHQATSKPGGTDLGGGTSRFHITEDDHSGVLSNRYLS